ncbi:hypothetical protein Vadar_031821 [Vaccinium darrowii]|uniref:Uncharacterized protein n=1 Tax=Vaccinium darrowii TaxID=229202 RepID=A0ACB7X5S3_9ERIC|nr:hypothetical protein Vadar_031821 [Vaccinium darrowii]
MRPSFSSHFFAIFIILTLFNTITISAKTNVRIINALGTGIDLVVHCKSKDDNLGSHVIPFKGSYGWSFNPNFFLTTLFYCHMQWKGHRDVYFNIYDENRDAFRCYDDCFAAVTEPAICLYDPMVKDFNLCFDWNKVNATGTSDEKSRKN